MKIELQKKRLANEDDFLIEVAEIKLCNIILLDKVERVVMQNKEHKENIAQTKEKVKRNEMDEELKNKNRTVKKEQIHAQEECANCVEKLLEHEAEKIEEL